MGSGETIGKSRNADKIQHKVPYRPCFSCGLDIWPQRKSPVFNCWCGIAYSSEVLDQITTSEWFCAFFEEGYMVKIDGKDVVIKRTARDSIEIR